MATGPYGCVWSDTYTDNDWESTGPGAYFLDIAPSNLIPTNGPTARWYAFPVRCLASGV